MTMAYEHDAQVLQLTDRTDPITELVAGKVGGRDLTGCATPLAAWKSIGLEKTS